MSGNEMKFYTKKRLLVKIKKTKKMSLLDKISAKKLNDKNFMLKLEQNFYAPYKNIEARTPVDDSMLKYLSNDMLSDKEFMFEFVKNLNTRNLSVEYMLGYINSDFLSDKEFAKMLVEKSAKFYEKLKDNYADDFDVTLCAVKHSTEQNLKFASENLKDNLQIVKTAVKANYWNLQHASKNLQTNKDVLVCAMQGAFNHDMNFGMVQIEHKEMLSNVDIMLELISKDICCLAYTPKHLFDDKNFVNRLANLLTKLNVKKKDINLYLPKEVKNKNLINKLTSEKTMNM